MNHTGFWNEWRRYSKVADQATDYYIKSIQYAPSSIERKILRLHQQRKATEEIPFLNRLIDYLQTTPDQTFKDLFLKDITRLRELSTETANNG